MYQKIRSVGVSLLFASLGLGIPSPLFSVPPTLSEPSDSSLPECDLGALNSELVDAAVRAYESPAQRLRQDELRQIEERARQCRGGAVILAKALHSQAMCFLAGMELAEAEALYSQSIDVLRTVPGQPRLLAVSLADLGALYFRMRRLEESARTLREAILVMDQNHLDDPVIRMRTQITMAVLATSRGQFSRAKKLYLRVFTNFDRLGSQQAIEPFLLVAMLDYSQLILPSNPKEAERVLDKVLAQLEGRGMEYRGLLAWALVGKGRLMHSHGHFAEGEATATHGLTLAASVFNPRDPLLAEFRAGVGEMYLRTKHYREAEELYKAAISTWEFLGIENPTVSIVLEQYARILRKTGRKAEAKRLEARARRIMDSPQGRLFTNTVDFGLIGTAQ